MSRFAVLFCKRAEFTSALNTCQIYNAANDRTEQVPVGECIAHYSLISNLFEPPSSCRAVCALGFKEPSSTSFIL